MTGQGNSLRHALGETVRIVKGMKTLGHQWIFDLDNAAVPVAMAQLTRQAVCRRVSVRIFPKLEVVRS